MSEILVVCGECSKGKSTTCAMLYDELSKIAYKSEFSPERASSNWPLNTTTDVVDFVGKIYLKNVSGETKRVFIKSMGDFADPVRNALNKYIDQGVDIIVCCSRTRDRKNSTFRLLKTEFKTREPWYYLERKAKDKADMFNVKQPLVDEIVKDILNLISNQTKQ